MPVLRAISLLFMPAALSRRTSPILRMDNLPLGIGVLLGRCLVASSTEHRCPPRFSKAPPHPSRWSSPASQRLSALSRNACPDSIGISVRIRPDCTLRQPLDGVARGLGEAEASLITPRYKG